MVNALSQQYLCDPGAVPQLLLMMHATLPRPTPQTGHAVTIFTIGHSTHPIDEFTALLLGAGVALLVDIRSFPASRAMPQFNGDALATSLTAVGIGYRHLRALGGRRHHASGAPPSRNTWWRVAAFRNYADYAETPEFRVGLDELEALARTQLTAIMCAEAVWWRCHRRIVTDYLLVDGFDVRHIMGANATVAAELTPGARADTDHRIIHYRAGQIEL